MTQRGQWGSRLGFVLAAAGSAVGLGNIWKFPYITGENGGGLFVLIYLVCIVVVGLPIMIAEVLLGRATQQSPVPAFAGDSGKSAWQVVGLMGVVTGFVILSYYSVVAGWSIHYVVLSILGTFNGMPVEDIGKTFGAVYQDPTINLGWHVAFMGATIGIVYTGVGKGIEAAAKILMPALFVLMGGLLVDAFFQPGFDKAFDFLFKPHTEKLTAAGVLEALGHSFFTLSLGMGAMLTYGSYLGKKDDAVSASGLISLLDTGVALVACLILFPITFSFGMEAEAGPGLVFVSIPVALSQMTGGQFLSIAFFFMLFFAALSSGISLLEVVVSTCIDKFGWTRGKAAVSMGAAIFLFGIPSALSGAEEGPFSTGWKSVFGKNFFDSFDYLASNWFLPLGGLLIAIYVGWVMPDDRRRAEFESGSRFAAFYSVWLVFLRFVAPIAIIILFLYSIGVIDKAWLS
ncbi:MAG: sodium-dependent transporter [Deltaproteobacteria bacterium]